MCNRSKSKTEALKQWRRDLIESRNEKECLTLKLR